MTSLKKKRGNYDILAAFDFYVPGPGGVTGLLMWFLAGAVLGNIATLSFTLAYGRAIASEYSILVSYPIMFLPPMLAARSIASRNALMGKGWKVDNSNFGRMGGFLLAVLCVCATFALAFCMDAVNSLMPAMPIWMEQAMKSLTGGKFWVNFVSVCVFAPFFEEWLCRGAILRGLLKSERRNGRQMNPWTAITISALIFGLIHLNPWQALPAFALGLLFGFVYWKTGSLRLTMLMHFTNNFAALVMSRRLDDSLMTWMDVLHPVHYWGLFLLFAAFLVYFVIALTKNAGEESFKPIEL